MHSQWAILQTALLYLPTLSWAQASVPPDLSTSFDPNNIALQVNYNNQAEFGFQDGTVFTPQQVSTTPVFALGDASGINTQIQFVVAMIDTTSDDRVLHFLQTDFASDGSETGIASSAKPVVPYAAPGTLGETGIRQYSWLLYQQVGDFPAINLPSLGQVFSVEQFEALNNLQQALAGIGMSVDFTSGSSTASSSSSSTSPTQQSTTAVALTQSTIVSSASTTSTAEASLSAKTLSTSTQALTPPMTMMTMSEAPVVPTTYSNPNQLGAPTIATSVMAATMSMMTTSSSAATTATHNAASPRLGSGSVGITTWTLLTLGAWLWFS
ncbi:MAG: hypothetical protein MMC33_003556 [Icmadophila ericetorum]|nr:hypothetical protein [Icmadophila ericetorum]